MEVEIPNNTHTKLIVAGKPAKVRQPNPILLDQNYIHATRYSVKDMEKLRDWLDRAIAWRTQG